MRLNLIAFVVITLLSFGLNASASAQEGRWGHGSRRNYTVYAPDTTSCNHHNCDYDHDCYYGCRYSRKYYRHKYRAEKYYHDHYYHSKYSRYHRYHDRWDDDRYYFRGGGY